MKYSTTGTDPYMNSDCKFQARAMTSIVQRLWSQLSLSYSRKWTCFQNSERMGGTEIYQATTVSPTNDMRNGAWNQGARCKIQQNGSIYDRRNTAGLMKVNIWNAQVLRSKEGNDSVLMKRRCTTEQQCVLV